METYTLPYVKWIAGGNLLYDAGNPKLVLCANLERWDREGRWQGALGEGDICIPMTGSC